MVLQACGKQTQMFPSLQSSHWDTGGRQVPRAIVDDMIENGLIYFRLVERHWWVPLFVNFIARRSAVFAPGGNFTSDLITVILPHLAQQTNDISCSIVLCGIGLRKIRGYFQSKQKNGKHFNKTEWVQPFQKVVVTKAQGFMWKGICLPVVLRLLTQRRAMSERPERTPNEDAFDKRYMAFWLSSFAKKKDPKRTDSLVKSSWCGDCRLHNAS